MFIEKTCQTTPKKLKEIIIRNIQKLKHDYVLSFAYRFTFGRAHPQFQMSKTFPCICLRCLEQVKHVFPNVGFSNKSKFVNGIYLFSRPLGSTKRLNWLNEGAAGHETYESSDRLAQKTFKSFSNFSWVFWRSDINLDAEKKSNTKV